MPDKLMRAVVSIPSDTGVPKDASVNVWHFDGDDNGVIPDASYHAGVLSLLTAFYQAVDAYLGPQVASPATLKIYDMRDVQPRVPEYENTIALTPGVGTNYPAEVAICVSYQADRISGENQARRRGRIFLGPLDAGTGAVVSSALRVAPAVATAIAAAAGTLQDGYLISGGPERVRWAVYSPTIHAQTGDIDDAFNDVITGWVDNAFDVQRRRGQAATVRTTFA
jgi:hypothetical protein